MDYLLKMGIIEQGRDLPPDSPSAFQPTSNSVYQVRVMPDMANIWEIDEASGYYKLPWYPNFFADSHNAYQQGDLVWLFIDEDYHVGFIIGYAQTAGGHDISSLVYLINTNELMAGFDTQSSLNDLTIQKLDEKCITAVNRTTGRVIQIYNNRIIYIFGEDGTIYGTNGVSFTLSVSRTGDISLSGASKTESISGDVDITANDLSESYHSVDTETVSGIKMNAGGVFQASAGGDMNHNAFGTQSNTASQIHNAAALNISNTVSVGSIDNVVDAGSYTITVVGGAVNIAATTIIMEAPLITMIGLVTIVGALNTATSPFHLTAYNPLSGFQAGYSLFSAPIPLQIGI